MGLGGEHACLIRVSSITQHKGKLRHLVEVSGKDSWKVANVLATPETRKLQSTSSKGYLDVIETPGCPLYEVLASTRCFLVKETIQEGFLEWDVIGESIGVVNSLVRKLSKSGAEVALVRMDKINGGRRLTNRQEQVLRQAYESGFFESPHETSMKQLAQALGCSPSTLDRLLRKAEKKAVAEKLGIS
jgi:predicted DNA binding protein